MQANVNRRMSRIGHTRALVQAEGCISLAQQQRGEAVSLQFLPQAQAECQGHILLRQLIAERRAALVSAVARIHHHEILHRTSEPARGPPLLVAPVQIRT